MKNTAFRRQPRLGPVVLACALFLLAAVTAFAHDWTPAEEKEVGDEAVAEVKKQYKLWDKPDQVKRIQDIVNNIETVTPRPDVKYQILLLDTDEENAMSIPGGHICVTRGLINWVQSDDELAGVLAHEIGHNCTFDALNEARQSQQMTMPVLAAVVAAMVMGRGSGALGGLATGAVYVTQSLMSTYSIKIESRADHNGMSYLIKLGKYNPVGMLTFMERLAAQERSAPEVDMGIYQDHPLSVDRVTALTDQLEAAGITINRRAVTKWDPPKVTAGKVGSQEAQVLSLWGSDLLSYNYAPPGTDLAARGQAMVKTLTALLAAGVEGWEFSTTLTDGGGAVIQAEGQDVIHLYPEDAALHGTTVLDLARQAQDGLDKAFFTERLQQRY
jgi:Zn-dependent protease with chaperone function